jgi:DnaK suppressor protein
LEKQQLKYGLQFAPGLGLGARNTLGKRMGKSSSLKNGKKPAVKVGAKAAASGRGSVTRKASVAKATEKPKKRGGPGASQIVLAVGYRPVETEPFMNERHKMYFRNKLIAWKEEIVRQNRETLHVLHEDSAQHADIADRATSETDRALELRARDRQRKLISKIDSALARIEDGSYGFCEETGEPIGLKRLEARPIATLSLEAQERHERREKVFRED